MTPPRGKKSNKSQQADNTQTNTVEGNGVISNILLLVRLRKIQKFAAETEGVHNVYSPHPNMDKMKQNPLPATHTSTKFGLSQPTTPAQKACPGVWQIDQVILHWFCLQQAAIKGKQLLTQQTRQFPLPHVSAETPFVLNLCRSCVPPQFLLFQMCIRPTVSERCCFLDGIHHLWLLRSFCFLFCIDSLALVGVGEILKLDCIIFLNKHTQGKWHSVTPVLTQLTS